MSKCYPLLLGHGKGDLFHSGGMSVTLGRKEAEMAAHLQGYVLNHKAQSLKPRGLSNRSNWCFVNAIMQALVACPPFFNLMKSLPAEIGETIHLLNSPLKILAAVNAFVAEFTALENFPRMNHRRDKNKKPEDLPLGKTFEAATIFQVLLNLNSDTFKVIEGRQEDAEEFLTFLLNGLNDEMLSVLKLVNNNECGSNYSADEENQKVGKIEEEEGADEWQEVGPKNKSCITRRGGDLVTFFLRLSIKYVCLFPG
jgi:ubiquitin carboxyl-terminal hydrolase 10